MQQTEFQHRMSGQYEALIRRWLPDGGHLRGSVQIVHGMAEHGGRYARLAEALTAAGFAVYAHDLPGHGPQCAPEHRGHFADRRGWRLAVASIREVQRLAQREHAGLPHFLLGHSMGSFLVQHYLADFGSPLAGAILSATTGDFGALRPIGLGLIRAEAFLYGRRHPSAVGQTLSFKSFNRAFRPARTEFDWLSRDAAEVDKYIADPHCGFRCTSGLWIDLLEAGGRLTDPARLRRVPMTLPILMIAGSDDPVSRGDQGPLDLEQRYRRAGLRNVTVRIYPGARHELFNETCRDEVTAGLVQWLGDNLPPPPAKKGIHH